MKRYIITWDVCYGETARVIEAYDLDHANKIAYDEAREEFEDNAVYGAEEYTEERAEELDLA